MTRPSTAARSRGSSTVGEGERGMADSRLGTGFSRSYRSRTMGRSDDRPRLPTGTVTFLFTDIEGSTRLLQDLDDRYGEVRDTHPAILRRAIRDGHGSRSAPRATRSSPPSPPAGAVRSAVAAQRSTLQPATTNERPLSGSAYRREVVGQVSGRPSRAAPPSRVQVGRGRVVLRAAGGPVDLDRYPLGGGPRFHQLEGEVRAGVGEQPRALADDHRADQQGELVDQLVGEEPADQVAAAVHLQLASRLGLQLADGGREVTGEDGRVRPLQVGEGGRGHVLGLGVQRRPDGLVVAARIRPGSPGAGEDPVGPPAEQERIGSLIDLVQKRAALVVEQRRDPAAALESAPAVLLRPAQSLHHAVDGDHRDGRELHDRGSLLVGWGPTLPRFPLTPRRFRYRYG